MELWVLEDPASRSEAAERNTAPRYGYDPHIVGGEEALDPGLGANESMLELGLSCVRCRANSVHIWRPRVEGEAAPA
jgi:hypothetical protein